MVWKVRRGGNPDSNNQDIADLARRLGAKVVMTTGVGFDFPDQVWGFKGLTLLVEVTNPKAKNTKPHRDRKARQKAWRDSWPGGVTVEVQTGDDVIQLLTGDGLRRAMRRQLELCGFVPATLLTTGKVVR